MMKKLIAVIITVFSMVTIAHAAAPVPAKYANKAVTYLDSRFEADVTYRVASKPYLVSTMLPNAQTKNVWAVDVKVISELGRGHTGRDMVTVVFDRGVAVATARDLPRRLVRVQNTTTQFAVK